MAQFTKETITTKSADSDSVISTQNEATKLETTEYMIYFIFGFLEILLAARFILKLTGASSVSGFVKAIYGVTGMLVYPFEGIFSKWFTPGLETTSVFEPSTLVALAVFAVMAWGIVKLVRISSGEKQVD